MKNLKKNLVMFGLITGFILAVNLSATAQTRISFAKGASEKTISVTIPANGKKSFVLAVNKKQAINVNALTKGNLLELSFSLVNAGRSDNFEDYEGGLTVLTGRKGDYVFSVLNNSKKSRTLKMKVRVGAASEYEGGISNE
jgi:hypothetical protein